MTPPDDDVERFYAFDQAVYERAQLRLKSAPLTLDDDDLDQLALVSPALEREAIERRKRAQLALVRSGEKRWP